MVKPLTMYSRNRSVAHRRNWTPTDERTRVAHSDDGIQAVVLGQVLFSVRSSYSEIPNNCPLSQLPVCE